MTWGRHRPCAESNFYERGEVISRRCLTSSVAIGVSDSTPQHPE
jgi:hypothetical protein